MHIAVVISSTKDAIKIFKNLSSRQLSGLLFEFRIDFDENLFPILYQLSEFNISANQIILTVRSENEGGNFSGNRSEIYNKIFDVAIQIPEKIGYLDLEIDNDLKLLKDLKPLVANFQRLILSKHDYTSKMIQASKRFTFEYQQLLQMGTLPSRVQQLAVLKFVGKPEDALDTIMALEEIKKLPGDKIALGIGLHGVISRTIGSHFDQFLVFGSTEKSQLIPWYTELVGLEKEDDKMLTGLIGQNLSHSLSPKIHAELRKQVGIPGYYHLFEFNHKQRLQIFIDKMRNLPLKGVNITFPYKSDILDTIDEITEEVEILGATNTLHVQCGKLIAHNTDVSGFEAFFRPIDNQELEKILIFGAGGAAKAVGLALLKKGKEITFVNRSKKRFENFPEKLTNDCYLETLPFEKTSGNFDAYINATTIGYGNISPTSILPIPASTKLVIDLNYSMNKPTPLIKEAKRLKIESHDGKAMLINQAIKAFEIWSGLDIEGSEIFQIFVDNTWG